MENGMNKINNQKIKYMGSYTPLELPKMLNGKLGLIWDGAIDNKDENINPLKNYTKYNSPHKMSCYLAAGIPIIAWKKAAIAETINKYNIGYLIDNIYQINSISYNDYEEKKKNAERLSLKIREGFFIKKALSKIENDELKEE